MKQKRVFLMCGVPGSGKTTWVKKQISLYGGKHISRDAIRFNMLSEKDEYFSKEDAVFAEFCHQAQLAIDDDEIQNVYIDATHLNSRSRSKTLNRLKGLSRCELIYVAFDISLNVCKERNSHRTGRECVPDSVISNMYGNYSIPYVSRNNGTLWVVDENEGVEVYP